MDPHESGCVEHAAQTTSCSNLSFAGSSQSGMRKRRKSSPNSSFKTVDKGLTEDTLTLNCKSCKATLVEPKNKNMELNNKLKYNKTRAQREHVSSVCKYLQSNISTAKLNNVKTSMDSSICFDLFLTHTPNSFSVSSSLRALLPASLIKGDASARVFYVVNTHTAETYGYHHVRLRRSRFHQFLTTFHFQECAAPCVNTLNSACKTLHSNVYGP